MVRLCDQTYGRLGGEGTKLLCDLMAIAAANGQSDDGGPNWKECRLLHKQTHAKRPAHEPPLLLAE